MKGDNEERDRRIRSLLKMLFEASLFGDDGMEFDEEEEEVQHSPAAGLVLATSEIIAAILNNGSSVSALRKDLLKVLLKHAKPYGTLTELVQNWAEDGDDNPFRLSELHDYNALVRGGMYSEGGNA